MPTDFRMLGATESGAGSRPRCNFLKMIETLAVSSWIRFREGGQELELRWCDIKLFTKFPYQRHFDRLIAFDVTAEYIPHVRIGLAAGCPQSKEDPTVAENQTASAVD